MQIGPILASVAALTAAKSAYRDLFRQDVARGGYKASVVADPDQACDAILNDLSLEEVRRLTRELRAEMRLT